MYDRIYEKELRQKLSQFPIVAILGARQCGKTTFARRHLAGWSYFDLEKPSDRRPFESDIESRLRSIGDRCIIDEAQSMPELFPVLRSLVDEDRQKKGRWVLLGSASFELIRGISESLAGRIAFIELPVLQTEEISTDLQKDIAVNKLIADRWFRGGYPEAWMQDDDEIRFFWFEAYQKTFIERDILRLGVGVHSSTASRLWASLAYGAGSLWNASSFGAALGINYQTVNKYTELLEGAFLVRKLTPWYANIGKRLTKSPKLIFRDTGLLHYFLGIRSLQTLDVHPFRGHSWENFIIESLISKFSRQIPGCHFGFWRTLAGAEVDLIVENASKVTPIEIKLHTSPVQNDLRGLTNCIDDLGCEKGVVLHGGDTTYTIGKKILALPASQVLLDIIKIDL